MRELDADEAIRDNDEVILGGKWFECWYCQVEIDSLRVIALREDNVLVVVDSLIFTVFNPKPETLSAAGMLAVPVEIGGQFDVEAENTS